MSDYSLKNEALKRWALAIVCAVFFAFSVSQTSTAQTPPSEGQVEQPATAQVEPPEQQIEPADTPAEPKTLAPDGYEDALAARRAADADMRSALDSGDTNAYSAAVTARGLADQAIADAAAGRGGAITAAVPAAPKTDVAPSKGASSEAIKTFFKAIINKVLDWLGSVAFLVMVASVIFGFFLAKYLTKKLLSRVDFLREAPTEGKALRAKKIGFQLRDLVFPAILITIYAIASPILKNVPALGQDWLMKIAQGLAVVFLLFTAIKRFIKHPIIQKLVIWIAIPIAVLKVFGWYDKVQLFLMEDAVLELGNIKIPAWSIFNLLIFGGILFWVGRISNSKGKEAIRSQDSIDVGTRELFAKIFEMMIFGLLIVLLMGIAGIPMTSLVVLGAPLMLGIGFGMQGVVANFISGMILLLDRSLKIGDFVKLPDGREGYVQALNMRSATVETTDGKDIMVPNIKFIEESYENWTHTDPRQRYEVYFSVAYNTDIDKLEKIIIPAISKHHQVLQEPEKPDLELREFGDFGIDFAVEFWADGIDDGENKFTSDLNFIVWRTLKKHGIVMPLPQREIKMLT